MTSRLDANYLAHRLAERERGKSRRFDTEMRLYSAISVARERAGVRSVPPDLSRFARSLGVHQIREVPLSINGRIVELSGQREIEIRRDIESRFRKRWIIAHELAHLILENERQAAGMFTQQESSNLTGHGYRQIEALCDAGAAEIVIPERWLVRSLPAELSLRHLLDLAVQSESDIDFLASRILDLGLWRGAHILWWRRHDQKLVVERGLPEEDEYSLSLYESLEFDALPGQALARGELVRGSIEIRNGFLKRTYRAEAAPVSSEVAISLF